LTRRNRLSIGFWLSLGWLSLAAVCAASAPLLPIAEYDRMDWRRPIAPPGTAAVGEPGQESRFYLLGTDAMGRDITARLVYGARVSLTVGLASPLIGLVLGGGLGILAGYYRGRLETLIAAVIDVMLAFPGIVLLLAVTFYLGPGLGEMVLALGILTVPSFARVARANTLTYSQREFVLAAGMLGQNDLSILVREILPNVIMPLMVYGLLVVSYLIVAEGALSFIGLGVPPPMPSWGGMVAQGKEVLEEAPHVSLFPALAMYLTVMSFNLIGDALRRRLDAREERF
jgi:peptide/nickel transport system permease protein